MEHRAGAHDEHRTELMDVALDPRTGRPFGDHGTALDAINFVLKYEHGFEMDAFLRGWLEGHLDEWPEFYEWLKSKQA